MKITVCYFSFGKIIIPLFLMKIITKSLGRLKPLGLNLTQFLLQLESRWNT